MTSNKEIRIAVLIDADNIPSANVKGMLEEITKYGTPTIKRIYGDWTKPHLSGWKNLLLENAITPIQQYAYTIGKNSTDSSLIIDAMDILYSDKVQGFAIVSSDSDFTRLATRLREAGMMVIGLGERKTPNPFIVACDKFVYLEILGKSELEVIQKPKAKSQDKVKVIAPKHVDQALERVDSKTIKLISRSIADLADDGGWVFLGELGSFIIKKQPDFDPRNFGYDKLGEMVKSINKFEIDERETDRKGIKLVYVRLK